MYRIEKNHPLVDIDALVNNIDEILVSFKNKFEEEYEESVESYDYRIEIADIEVTSNVTKKRLR
jgi:hypothetical protein